MVVLNDELEIIFLLFHSCPFARMGGSDHFTPMLRMFVWESGTEQLKKIILSLLIPLYGVMDWILIEP